MMITTRRRIGSDSKSLAEIYRKYKKEVENPVDYNTFRTIIETTHLTIFEEICKRKNKIYLSRTIGWFTSQYPLLLEVQEENISTAIKEIKETLETLIKRKSKKVKSICRPMNEQEIELCNQQMIELGIKK